MDSGLNINAGSWLSQLNGKTVDKIFQVDFNTNRNEDIYLPWIFFITFIGVDKFLEIEGDFDGDHIKMYFTDIRELDKKLKDNDLQTEPDLWRIYDTKKNEVLGELLGRKIEFIEYGIDKEQFEIKGTLIKGEKDVFNFIRFNSKEKSVTIFEGSATGLGVSNKPGMKLNFEGTFDKYDTK